MENIFKERQGTSSIDDGLVAQAMQGNRKAIEQLIRRHQKWVFNIALRMVGEPVDAEDIAQEVLIKIVKNLPGFKMKSSFRTWAYRIVVNHVLNMRRRDSENKWTSFAHYGKDIDDSQDQEFPALKGSPVEKSLIILEVKMHCLMGTLLCLNRKQRLVFILGEMFCISDSVAGEILECTKDNFRQTLSRARRKIFDFLKERCGLMDKKNPCHCQLKAKPLMDAGVIDPGHLYYAKNGLFDLNRLMEDKYSRFSVIYRGQFWKLIREQPFLDAPDFVQKFRKMLSTAEFMDIFNLQH
jgi:RNA polymerase sigma factor (sigma-70 family)